MDLIFDRTLEDVRMGTPKGCYSWEDLNRVEKAVAQLQLRMRQMDLSVTVSTKTDWALPQEMDRDQWPAREQMDRYLQNVLKLLTALRLQKPLPASMKYLDYQGANQIEAALFAVEQRLDSIESTYQFSGECIAGKENTI